MLGRYHLIEEIEQDGLGLLHLARLEGPSGFQRWAVVRRLHPALENDAKLVDAFFEAARVAALVQHSNVAVVFDVGQRDGPSWVAREYLHGESVADLVAEVRLTKASVPWDLACRIVADAALGAETLRDLRPDDGPAIGFLEGAVTPLRTIVTYDGKTKLVEGCLPLLRGRPLLDANVLAYRAPELHDDDYADGRADVFALGVMLWELCAGKHLFGGGTEAEIRARVDARAVPFLRASVRCPSMVDEVIRRALARDPELRHPGCRVLARELESCLVSKGLNVTDDDIGRYMLGVFADRFEEREASLLSAANVTEVFDRAEVLERVAAARAASRGRPEPPGDDEGDAIDSNETPDATTALAMKRIVPVGEPKSPDETAVMYVQPFPESKPLGLIEKKKALVSGFDELSTVPRNDGKRPPGVPKPAESLIFVGAGADDTTDAVPDSLVAETIRTPHVDLDDGPTTARSYDASPPIPLHVQAPAPAGAPLPRPIAMPVLPPKPPSLTAVLIAHEQSTRKSYWLPLVGLGVAALLGVVATLLFRHLASDGAVTVARVANSAATADSTAAPSAAPPPPPPPPTASEVAAPAPSAPPQTVAVPADPPPKAAVAPPPPTSTGRADPPPTRRPTKEVRTPAAPVSNTRNGLLTVLCTPACDDVLDGGRSLGPSPVFKVSVPVGSHRLTLVSNDPPARKVVSVNVNEEDVAVVRESLNN